MKSKLFLPVVLFLLASVVPMPAQTDRGVISGSVTDASGAVIAGAKVSAIHVATNVTYSTVSTSTGDFTIPSLTAGDYQLKIEQQGFKTYVRSGINVSAGGSVRVNASLELGAVTESIEVTTAVVQLQTESARVTSQVSNKLVDELPLVVGGAMRSPFDLALITPEAKLVEGSGTASDESFALGGGQAAAWGVTLDGVSAGTGRFGSVQWANVNTPSVDAITEFTVETNGFKAEYGRASGGIMTFTSKSGTNEFHGTAYEFIRNDAFDARRFFEAEKGAYKQHDFGWSAGGPVVIPWLYNGKNKTFFFSAMEWFRNRVGADSGFFSVPTAEMYRGDFSNWVDANGRRLTIYDPATTRPNPTGAGFIRTPFPNNVIPEARFSNYSKAVLKEVGSIGNPNNGAQQGTSDYVRNNYVNRTGTALDPWTKFSIKGDHNFNLNNKLNFLYNYGTHAGPTPGPQGFPGLPGTLNSRRTGDQRSDVYRLTYTRVLRPTIVNYFYAGGNNWRELNASPNARGGWKARGICLINAFDCDLNFPQIDYSDYDTWGGSSGDGSENTVYSFGDDLTITRGRHTFKTGYLYERIHYNGFGRQSLAGLIRGDRRSTSIPGDNNLSTGGGNGFASFLLGEAFSGGTENYRFVSQQWRSHSLYFQDDWKLSQRLTLNIGLRYDFTLPPLEADDKWSDFTPDRPNPGADGRLGALRFAGEGTGREGTRTLVPGWYGGWGPRVGLAYSPNDKTVVRVGAARSFGVVKTVTGSTHFEGFISIFRPSSTDGGITPAFRLDTGLPPFPQPPRIDPAFSNGNNTAYWNNEAVRLPESYDWTLSLQRQLSSSLVFETSYNATIGAHLVAGLLVLNQVPVSAFERYGLAVLQSNIDSAAARNAGLSRPYPSYTGSVAQALRPYPQYLNIQTREGHGDKSGHSSYHAWLMRLEKRYSTGLTFQGSYVLSKLITDADSYTGDNAALDHYNRRLEKSIGQFDQTHSLKFSYVYELPFGRGKRWLNRGPQANLLGGWRISGTHYYSSGNPLELTNNNVYNIFNGRGAAAVQAYDGWIVNNDNPNWLGSDRFLQPKPFFGPQPANRLGNSTRHNPKARSFPNYAENIAVAKSFGFGERFRIDLRGEAFNLLNRTRFSTATGGFRNLDDPNFGRVRAQINEPRRMQLALKLYF